MTILIGVPSGVRVFGPWCCYAGERAVSERRGGRVYVIDICTAPPGIRCSCGTQLAGHDPGDEDPRRP